MIIRPRQDSSEFRQDASENKKRSAVNESQCQAAGKSKAMSGEH